MTRVLIGLEHINPDSLIAARKKQNRIAEYRAMLLAWKRHRCFIYAVYVLGFANDTPETIVPDIRIIRCELPLDLLEFFRLTPLPGSEDHKWLLLYGVPMDPDMNKYDLEHVCTTHSRISKAGWEHAYRLTWQTYYSPEYMATMMRRAAASGISSGKMMILLLWFASCVVIERIHPLEGGYLRRKVRTERRPGTPIAYGLTFCTKYAADLISKHVRLAWLTWRVARVRQTIKRDPRATI